MMKSIWVFHTAVLLFSLVLGGGHVSAAPNESGILLGSWKTHVEFDAVKITCRTTTGAGLPAGSET